MGFEEDFIGSQLIQLLGPFVKARRLGVVVGAQAPFRVIRRDVRMPDVAYISADNWRNWNRAKPSVAPFAPDLAIEILSRTNTRAEMARKRSAYFAGGTRIVWEVNPRRRTVTVYTNPTSADRLMETDTLTGGDVLPGFKLKLSELFADPLG
jgi:Uma2 family endonuclease